jgi:hypothetical protein
MHSLRKAKAKEKPKRTWAVHSVSLRTRALRAMLMQVVGLAVFKFVAPRL